MREVEGRWGSGVLTRMLSPCWCAGLFVVDSHSKKRPHNLIFGRMFDHRLYDMLELGVESVRSIKSFGKAGVSVQAGNKVKPQPLIRKAATPKPSGSAEMCLQPRNEVPISGSFFTG